LTVSKIAKVLAIDGVLTLGKAKGTKGRIYLFFFFIDQLRGRLY